MFTCQTPPQQETCSPLQTRCQGLLQPWVTGHLPRLLPAEQPASPVMQAQASAQDSQLRCTT